MGGLSFDPDDFDIPRRKRPSAPDAEVELWLETLESLLADVADDPELAEPLARVIARTKDRQQAATERTKRALSSIDSILHPQKRSGRSDRSALGGGDGESRSALLALEAALLRRDPDGDPSDS